MAGYAHGIIGKCPGCKAAKYADGSFSKSEGAVSLAASLKNISIERCGDCSGMGLLYGGYPRRSMLGLTLGGK